MDGGDEGDVGCGCMTPLRLAALAASPFCVAKGGDTRMWLGLDFGEGYWAVLVG